MFLHSLVYGIENNTRLGGGTSFNKIRMVYDDSFTQLHMTGHAFICGKYLHSVTKDTFAWRVFLHSLVDVVENKIHLKVVLGLMS